MARHPSVALPEKRQAGMLRSQVPALSGRRSHAEMA